MTKRVKQRKVDGTTILYHYLQKSLQNDDIWLYQNLVAKLITSLGVWFPPSSYAHLPIPLPYVVRDNTCRKRKVGQVDQWSSPDEHGFLRDDNSLVKNLNTTFSIHAQNFTEYNKKKMGKGFIAAHVWRITPEGDFASRNHLGNSFWPNLVWLPGNVAKLTDREGSFAQKFVQALSLKIYRNVQIHENLLPFVEDAWKLFPTEHGILDQVIPELDKLNYFEIPENFIPKKISDIRIVSEGLRRVSDGLPLENKILHTRYTKGLPEIEKETAKSLSNYLKTYHEASEASFQSTQT